MRKFETTECQHLRISASVENTLEEVLPHLWISTISTTMRRLHRFVLNVFTFHLNFGTISKHIRQLHVFTWEFLKFLGSCGGCIDSFWIFVPSYNTCGSFIYSFENFYLAHGLFHDMRRARFDKRCAICCRVCCSVVAVLLQCCCSDLQCVALSFDLLQCVAVCRSSPWQAPSAFWW